MRYRYFRTILTQKKSEKPNYKKKQMKGWKWYIVLVVSLITRVSIHAFPLLMPKLILLDRDGVVNEDVGAPGVVSTRQFRLTPNAATSIGRLKRQGCRVVLVTNQSCVGKGIITKNELDSIHDYMTHLLQTEDEDAIIDRIHVCTSTSDGDVRKKPNPGMILEAMRDFETTATPECTVVLIGDTVTDLQAAAAANVPLRILVSTGYGKGIMGREAARDGELVVELSDSLPPEIVPFYYLKNLAAAVDFLLQSSS